MKSFVVFVASLLIGITGVKLYNNSNIQKPRQIAAAPAAFCPAYTELKFTQEETTPTIYDHCEKCSIGVYRKDDQNKEICSYCYERKESKETEK